MASYRQREKNFFRFGEDWLSSLPESAIEAILVHLPLRDAIRTRILSRVWRHQWLPDLVFDSKNFPRHENKSNTEFDSEIAKIVDEVILLHEGPIRRFELCIDIERCRDIDRWVIFLSRRGIKEFILHKSKGETYKVHTSLFSLVKDLTHLELSDCILIPPSSFDCFSNLRTLDLQYVCFSNNEELANLISKCPVLNKLILRYIGGCNHIKLQAPNLVDLLVQGAYKLSLEKTPVLAKASIKLMSIEHQDFSSGAIRELISLPSVRRLKLLAYTLKVMSAGHVPVRLPTPSQLLSLTLDINMGDIKELLAAFCIFRSCSFLQKVDIWKKGKAHAWHFSRSAVPIHTFLQSCSGLVEQYVDDFWEAREDFNCLFRQLKVLNVKKYCGSLYELKFVEFVLANAPVLETVQIELEDTVVDGMEILEELLLLRRLSSKAVIIISY